jgi:hypothetical protein
VLRSAGVFAFVLGSLVCCATASAQVYGAGYVSWDVTFPGEAGEFDITNLTGPNNTGDTFFPVTTELELSNLSLLVNFAGGGSETFGPLSGYFSLSPDGESFNGTSIPIGGTNPEPISATLSGNFSATTVTLDAAEGGSTINIKPTFAVSFSDTPNLVDGDLAEIFVRTVVSSTPEPGTWLMMATGLVLLLFAGRSRFAPRAFGGAFKAATGVAAKGLLPLICLVLVQSAYGIAPPAVKLAAYTTPSSGVAGTTNVNITGSSFPAGTITPANVVVAWENTCGGSPVVTTAANSVKTIVGSEDRVNINVPGTGLAPGTNNYFVQISDSAGGDANFISSNCSEVQVTASAPVLNACIAGSSIGVLLPAAGAAGNVTAYVPQGYWEGTATGVFVKNIEGTLGLGTTVPTANLPNSCSSNPATGQTVCVANNTDVYLISGTTLTNTLTSGANTTATFSGGTCTNCGVALNANNNTAVINMGVSGGVDGGVQILNLGTNTFNTPFPMTESVSENISVDPTRSLILSAGEGENFTLLQIQSNGSLLEFNSSFSTGQENDSNAEDCSTGIAFAPGEFTSSQMAFVNLNAVTLNSPSAGLYTAPTANISLTTAYGFAAGPSGSAVAQGSGHLAVMTGEFGGSTFAVLKLPATASSAVPALVDYVVASIPSSTACGSFSAGFDPHTVTAYTSPNTGDSMAVFAGYSSATSGIGVPICLAVVDMTKLITSATRGGGGYDANDIQPANFPAGDVAFFTLP